MGRPKSNKRKTLKLCDNFTMLGRRSDNQPSQNNKDQNLQQKMMIFLLKNVKIKLFFVMKKTFGPEYLSKAKPKKLIQ